MINLTSLTTSCPSRRAVSTEYIMTNSLHLLSAFENKYQYYYHTDYPLYSIGQISARFFISKKKDKGITLERKRMNVKNFQFSSDVFPILSDRKCRNTIERIDEHNQKLLGCAKKWVVLTWLLRILPQNSSKLRTRRTTHPYTLDSLNREILIVCSGEELLSINLNNLKEELLRLFSNIKYLKEISSDPFG